MELVKSEDLLFGRKGPFARFQAKVIMKIARLDGINRLYAGAFNEEGPYSSAALRILNVKYYAGEKETAQVPVNGAAVVVANHPTGLLDGIILIDLLTKIRPDVKFMGNFLLDRIEPFKQYFINVDPFDSKSGSNVTGVRASLEHLRNGGLLVIFPAGEVATWQKGFSDIKDKTWEKPIIKFVRKSGVPVIPLYIDCRNSLMFRLLGKIHPMLRTAMLPRELLNKRGKNVVLRIGSAIIPRMAEDTGDLDGYGDFLRANVEYMKPEPARRRHKRAARKIARKGINEIIDPVEREALAKELERIHGEHMLFEYGNYSVFLAPPGDIPHMMTEIGRMREITFREIGEGTNLSVDTDRFDCYYRQLFVWDKAADSLVGAYRFGMGREIMAKYGLKGFYTNTLFRMSEPMGAIMDKTIELGRSFIVKEYQRKSVSLMLLWKGILYVLMKNKEYRYLLGPVTISGEFEESSKLVLASFIRNFHSDKQLSRYIKPVTGFRATSRIDISLIRGVGSIDLINKLVSDIECGKLAVPVLIRRYLQLNSHVLGFNTDHDFNNALDALMLLDLKSVPESVIMMLSKELTDIDVIGRFRDIAD